MKRGWDWWTKHKLEILGEYLQQFAVASKKSDKRIYLDLFAGVPINYLRSTNEQIAGSVHRAMATSPPFTHIGAFELGAKARALRQALEQKYPGNTSIRVFEGDCNEAIDTALTALGRVRWAPTFAFIDQHSTEVAWTTLQKLAQFRQYTDPNKRAPKAELWILLGTSFYMRGLTKPGNQFNAKYGEAMTRMFGNESWTPIARARKDSLIEPAQCRAEWVNLMRWRLEQVLGYETTFGFTMKMTGGQDLYDMVFATDHFAGRRIMESLYEKATQQREHKRQHALELRREQRRLKEDGTAALFPLTEDMVAVDPGKHEGGGFAREAPHEPRDLDYYQSHVGQIS